MLRRLLVIAAAALGFAVPAHAASFDCSRATQPDERAVCASPALSELDATLGAYWFSFSRVPMMMGGNGARRDDALAFLHQRAACGSDAACMTRLYRSRLSVLRAGIDGAMTTFSHAINDPAPAPDPAALPPRVAQIVAGFANQCQRLGGAVAAGSSPRIMTADLDGDGVPDYVVDASTLRCSASASLYCANDGCAIGIAVSGNRYFDPRMTAGGGLAVVAKGPVAVVTLVVDRTNCAGSRIGDACRATFGWAAGKPYATYALQRH